MAARTHMAARGYSPATIRSGRHAAAQLATGWPTAGSPGPRRSHARSWNATGGTCPTNRQPGGQPLLAASQAQRLQAIRPFFTWSASRRLIITDPAAVLELPVRPAGCRGPR